MTTRFICSRGLFTLALVAILTIPSPARAGPIDAPIFDNAVVVDEAVTVTVTVEGLIVTQIANFTVLMPEVFNTVGIHTKLPTEGSAALIQAGSAIGISLDALVNAKNITVEGTARDSPNHKDEALTPTLASMAVPHTAARSSDDPELPTTNVKTGLNVLDGRWRGSLLSTSILPMNHNPVAGDMNGDHLN